MSTSESTAVAESTAATTLILAIWEHAATAAVASAAIDAGMHVIERLLECAESLVTPYQPNNIVDRHNEANHSNVCIHRHKNNRQDLECVHKQNENAEHRLTKTSRRICLIYDPYLNEAEEQRQDTF